MTEGSTLRALIEKVNYDYNTIQTLIKAEIEQCEQRIRELEAMSQKEFLRMKGSIQILTRIEL